jgi:hypothetical protein
MIVATVQFTDGSPAAVEVTLVAYTGSARDSVMAPLVAGNITLHEGRLSGGVYTVEVRAPGYVTWREDGIRVREEGHCGHTVATMIAAILAPSQGG